MICQGSTTASPSCGWCRWNQDCGAAVHCCPVSRWFCMILLQFQWFFEHLWTAFSDFAAIPTPRSLPPSADAAASQQCGGTARYKHRWLLSRIQKKSEIFWAFWSLSQCGWAGMSMNNLWTMLKPWPSNPCSLWVRKVNEPILLAFSRYPMGWTRSPHINHHWLHRVWRWLPVRPDPASGRGGWPSWLHRLTWLQH